MDDVLVIDNLDEHELQVLQEITEQMVECVMDNRHFGYWHIGQVYNKMAKFAGTRVPTDDMQLTQGQLLQVNFAPVWHGRMIGEVQNIIKTICMDRNGAESPDDFDRRRYQRLETEVLWLTEMRSHSVVFCDLALNVLHNRLYLIHLTEFIFILTLVLSRRELNGADGPLSDYVEQRGGHAAPFVASASMVLPVENSGVKRFKKAGTEQQANVVLEQASSVALSTAVAPAADALVSGWDFERDLEQIFAAETAALTSTAAQTSTAAETSTAAGPSTAVETSTGGAAVSSITGKAAGRKKKQAEDIV
jgi:hypothetical protein